MNFDKLIAMPIADLKKLISVSLKIGRKTNKNLENEIFENISNLKMKSEDEFIKDMMKKKILYTEHSPINYRWIIPD